MKLTDKITKIRGKLKEKAKFNSSLFFIGFMIFIFAPLEVYFSNINELWYSIYDFVAYLLAGFILYLFIILIWEYFIAVHFKKIWDGIVCILFSIGLALYIQGNFIIVNYGQLDGQPIEWTKYKREGIISVTLFLIAILVAIAMVMKLDVQKRKKAIDTISISIVLIQLVTLATLTITKDGFQRKENYVVTTKNQWEYAEDKNFNILVLDAFDSRVLYDLLQGECSEEIKSLFQDFTYYRNTTDLYNLTDFSVPQIITGKGYRNKEPYGEYLNKAYEESPFLRELKKNEYEVDIYTTVRLPQGDIAGQIDNWKKMNLSVSSHKRLLEYMYKLVGFRYLPQPLKQFCWFYSDEMDDLKCISYTDENGNIVEDYTVYDWSNKMFYEDTNKLTCTNKKNAFHFYHIKGLHVIRNLDSNFHDVEDASLEETAKLNFKMLDRYFNKLKEQGIYNNSVIMIMADHAANEYEDLQFKQCPLLMVKGMNESHDFAVSQLPVSYDDLLTGYQNLLNNTNADNIFEIKDDSRIRYLYQADWKGKQLEGNAYSEDFLEFSIEGDAFDSNKIKATGKVFSQGAD